ncbi:hypothetical protein O3M35_006150 [Rhynocoris fuscipes]|uniref:C2 domain-containing protein n=1 Tax=Rhynocoris fuscipes TaxID=488301 RepID=A0AAW1DDY4_9HEMI
METTSEVMVQGSSVDDFNVSYSSPNTSPREVQKTETTRGIYTTRVNSLPKKLRRSSEFDVNDVDKKETRLIGNNKILQTTDCFRFTIKEIKLNQSGSLKVTSNPTLKPTPKQIRVASAPGTLFSVEFRLPAKSLHRMSRKPTVFISKKFHGTDIVFGDSLSMKLPVGSDDNPWLKVSRLCATAEIKVYWRHLNQRLPTILGSTFLPTIKLDEIEDLTSTLNLTLPIFANPKLLVGKMYVCFELGRNNKAFGETLFKSSKPKQENLVKTASLTDLNSNTSNEEMSSEKSEMDKFPLKKNIENTESNYLKEKRLHLPIFSATTTSSQGDSRTEVGSEVQRVIDALNKKLSNKETNDILQEKNNVKDKSDTEKKDSDNEFKENVTVENSSKSEDAKVEKNLNVKEKEDEIKNSHKDKCCCCCKRCCHNHFNPLRCISDQKENSVVHEFTISIHKVCNFPLFTDHDMDCFVDYRFPYVSPIDGSLSLNTTPFSTETTIALRSTHFNAVHTHKLKLHKSLTEALVSLQKDLTLRLWARTYQSVPRDHKVAKARIPLTKLTSMEYKFEQEMLQGSVAEKLKIPLDTVRSSLTSGLQRHCENGYIIIGIHYRRYDALKGPVNEARNIVDLSNKNIKNMRNNFEEDYFNYYQNCDKVRSKISPLSPTDYHKQIHLSQNKSETHFSSDIPELDVGSRTDKKQMLTDSCRFDNSTSRDLPSRDFVNVNDSPFCHVNFDTKKSIPLTSQSSFTSRPFNIDKPTLESLTSSNDGSNSSHINYREEFSTARLHTVQLHPPPLNRGISPPLNRALSPPLKRDTEPPLKRDISPPLNRAISPPMNRNVSPTFNRNISPSLSPTSLRPVDLYSSQDPLQMRKDLVGCKISEEFEVLSEPSFLVATSPPRIERDFPPGVTTNFDMNSIATQDDNPFEERYHSRNINKDVGEIIDLNNVLPTNNRMSVCVAVETDSQASENKSTQTSLFQADAKTDSHSLSFPAFSDEWFLARVCIERAINIPLVSAGSNKDSDMQLIKPTTYVQFRAKSGDEVKVIRTVSFPNSTSPVWDSTWQIQLPSTLLYKNDEDFELYVGCTGQKEPLGKVCIDLTALSAGLSSIDGWYLISDGIKTSGQIKVTVTPLEDVSRFKDQWLKEYSNSKHRKKMDLEFELSKKLTDVCSTSKFGSSEIAPSIGSKYLRWNP